MYLKHTIPGEREIIGLTSLEDKLYVLRDKEWDIDVYSTTNYGSLPRLPVPELSDPTDMASCKCNKCLYISESSKKCIHKVQLNASTTKWSLNGEPSTLSVTCTGNVLVAYRKQVAGWFAWSRPCINYYILELNGDNGDRVRKIPMQQADISKLVLQHSVQLTTDQFVTCHTNSSDTHRVCIVVVDGKETKVTRSYGSEVAQLGNPCHLAVDTDSQFIFVTDKCNHRVVALSTALDCVCHITEQQQGEPQRLHLDPETQRLYIGLSDGRVTVKQLCLVRCFY